MAHFAEVDENNVVIRTVVVPDEQEHRGHEYLSTDMGLGGIWLKTSYNTKGGVHVLGGEPYRKNFAGEGMTYDPVRDAFIPHKPEGDFWVLNEETCLWEVPEGIIADVVTLGE